MKNKLLTTAVATALALPTIALGAIDDQGMQYVSASEGLHGSMRIYLFRDTDEKNRDVSTEEDSLRFWVNGTSDLGGGLQSVYYWEWRNSENSEDELGTEAYHLGLRGGFGEIVAGKIGMVPFRIVPSGNVSTADGNRRESPGSDPGKNGMRYESPVINGFQVGISAALNGDVSGTEKIDKDAVVFANDHTLFTDDTNDAENPDGGLDEFGLAVGYTLPIGLELGMGFVSVDYDGYSNTVLEDDHKPFELDTADGFHVGLRYGQDNWLLAYEYRTYDSFLGFSDDEELVYLGALVNDGTVGLQEAQIAALGVDAITTLNTAGDAFVDYAPPANATVAIASNPFTVANGHEDLEYDVHAFGARVQVDRFTFTANYSKENDKIILKDVQSPVSISTNSAAAVPARVLYSVDYEIERDTIALDAAYSLGSRSTIVLGWRSTEVDTSDIEIGDTGDVDETYLWYRVDF